jgi:hypothetical protein
VRAAEPLGALGGVTRRIREQAVDQPRVHLEERLVRALVDGHARRVVAVLLLR